MRVDGVRDLGLLLRAERRRAGLSQSGLAERAGVSRRWLLEFENGKATAEIGLVINVIHTLGLMIEVSPAPTPEVDLDQLLDNLGGPRA
jgi:HTH-type transcriptional regulator/antitoxin HipB